MLLRGKGGGRWHEKCDGLEGGEEKSACRPNAQMKKGHGNMNRAYIPTDHRPEM